MSEALDALNTPPAPPPPAPPAPPSDPNAPPAPPPPPPPSDRWQDKFLSDDLKADETIGRYNSIEDMAKGLIETRTWARGRVPIPPAKIEADADKAAFTDFIGKVRPEKAEAYEIPVPEGQPTETADFFRGKFFERGLHPEQARGLAADWNQYLSDQVSAKKQAGKNELTAIELDMGTPAYNQRIEAVGNMLEGMGIEVGDLVPALEQLSGAGAAIKSLFAMAERTGELAKVDGKTVDIQTGNMSAESAQAELDRQNANRDPAFNNALKDPNSPESKQRQALMARVAQGQSPKR